MVAIDTSGRRSRNSLAQTSLPWLARERCESGFDLPDSARLENSNLHAEGRRGLRYIPHRRLGGLGIGWIDQHGDPSGFGHKLVQEAEPLRRKLAKEEIDAGRITTRPGEARN